MSNLYFRVLSRKIYLPKTLNLEWHIIESLEDAKTKNMLKSEDLGLDFVSKIDN